MGATYATWNPSDKAAPITLSGGNLIATAGVNTTAGIRATQSKSAGKWYWEQESTFGRISIGVANSTASLSSYLGSDANGLGYDSNSGNIYKGGSVVATGGASYTTNDIIGIAYDADGGTVKFYKNNSLQYTISAGNVPTSPLFPMATTTFSDQTVMVLKPGPFLTYSPPSGYNQGLYTEVPDLLGGSFLLNFM